jgi:glycosyltransferase involved in cell wall biosynthesis
MVLHLLPADLHRGAQAYARGLREALDGQAQQHRTLTLFRSGEGALKADTSLDSPVGLLRRAGFDPRAAWRLFVYLRRHRPDLIIAHGGEALLYASVVRPRAARLIYKRTGVVSTSLRRWPKRFLWRQLMSRADLVVGTTPDLLTESNEVMGVADDRLRLIPNGRDPGKFGLGSLDRDPDAVPHLIWVGALTAGKRPALFLDVVAVLRRRGRVFEGVVVGDGDLVHELRSQANEIGVEVLGPRDDVPRLLAGADIFCFTSRGDGEGSPGVLIEAGFAGLPSVATDGPGVQHIIDNGRTGLVVGADDVESFADAVDELLLNPQRRIRMGLDARARSLELFTLQASALRWRAVIAEVLG